MFLVLGEYSFIRDFRVGLSNGYTTRVHIVLRGSKSVGAKGDVPKLYSLRVRAPVASMLTHSLCSIVIK